MFGGKTRCCDQPTLSLPRDHRITTNINLVTCGLHEHASEAELVAEVSRLEAQRDALIGSLDDITAHLRKVSVYADLPSIPVVEGVRQLVKDHEELESRIEAVLTIPEYPDSDSSWLKRAEVHALLRGGKRIPDTLEGIDS